MQEWEYLKCLLEYVIMPVGKKIRVSKMAQRKTPELPPLGFFYSVLGRWLIPKADYQLFISIQPFANIIGDYTCRNRDIK